MHDVHFTTYHHRAHTLSYNTRFGRVHSSCQLNIVAKCLYHMLYYLIKYSLYLDSKLHSKHCMWQNLLQKLRHTDCLFYCLMISTANGTLIESLMYEACAQCIRQYIKIMSFLNLSREKGISTLVQCVLRKLGKPRFRKTHCTRVEITPSYTQGHARYL